MYEYNAKATEMLKQLCYHNGLSIDATSKKIGIGHKMYYEWVKNRKIISPRSYKKIHDAYNAVYGDY